ncbi:MAG: peroxiredoxin [Planctomycetota bacterium]|jgi:thioredoxin-dependent peroxiredoxin
MPRPIDVGDALPDITLPNQGGDMIRLRSYVGVSGIVLFFYPKDDSLICTREACQFRDRYEDFKSRNMEVIGISDDPPGAHAGFAVRQRLPFMLLSDANGEARKQFGTGKTAGLLPGRVTYVVDRQGIVRHIYRSQFRAYKHITEALKAMEAEGAG